MRRSWFFCGAALLVWACISLAYGAEEAATDKGSARYVLYTIEINNNATPFLLDSKTGKIWIYEDEGGFGNKKKLFKGVSVEGLAYSPGDDIKTLERQLEQWHVDGLIDKELIGFKSAVSGEFSYFPDLMKVIRINEETKVLQKRGKEEKR